MTDATDLQAKVEARFSDERLRQLTRPDSKAYTTPDTDFLATACDDVIGEMDGIGAATYDNTDRAIVVRCVDAVVALLQYRLVANEENENRWRQARDRLGDLRKTRRGNRVVPTSSTDRGSRGRLFSLDVSDDVLPGSPGVADDDSG